MSALLLAVAAYGLLVVTWVLYLAIMNLSAHRHEMGPFARFNAYCVVLPIGYLFDAALNLLVCALFLRWPRDWLLTGTLKRHINTNDGWRCSVSAWVCEHLLNPFDPKGTHC